MKRGFLLWAAVGIGVVNTMAGLGAVVLGGLSGETLPMILSDSGWVFALSLTSVGVLIAVWRPRNPLGWIFCAIGFSQGITSFAGQYAVYALRTSPGALPLGAFMSWVGAVGWFPGANLLLTYALLLYPTGRLPSRRWRLLGWACALPMILFIPQSLHLWPYRGAPLIERPIQIPPSEGLTQLMAPFVFPLLMACGLASVISLFVRYRQAGPIESKQIKWVAFAAGIIIFGLLIMEFTAFGGSLGNQGLTFLIGIPLSIALPAAVGVAILRYRLWEIDLLINRTLVYVPLTGVLAGLYSASISVLQRAFVALTGTPSDGAVVLTTLLLVSTFTPLKNVLQGIVDRRFKDPREPLAPLQAFSNQVKAVEEVIDRKLAARRLLDEAVISLQASGGAVFLAMGGAPELVSTTGEWSDGCEALTIPITSNDQGVGKLSLAPRRDGTDYREIEVSLLVSLAERLGRVLSLIYAR